MKFYKLKFLLLVGQLLFTSTSMIWSQDAALVWENTIGGNSDDFGKCVISTSDGGYLIGGNTNSSVSGDLIEGSHGENDYLVVKLDSLGNIQWQQTYGGTGNDILTSMVAYQGMYIIGGYSNSPACPDKPYNSLGGYDYWVFGITSNGFIMWSKVIGGTGDDYLYSMSLYAPSAIILGGSSNSNASASKTENSRGGLDYWIVGINPTSGAIINQKTIGGNMDDQLRVVTNNGMGSYYIAGYSSSDSSGEKSEDSYGEDDYWVLKMQPFSNTIIWDRTLGSIGNDQAQCAIIDGFFELLVSGYSNSPIGGNKVDSSIAYDYWVLKLNQVNGNIIWQKTLSSSGDDYCFGLAKANNGDYLLMGDSYSPASYDLLQQTAGVDWWLISLDSATGNIEWQNTLTGSYDEYSGSVKHVNNGYIFMGASNSQAGYDKSETTMGPAGSYDFWVAKLSEQGCINPTFTGVTLSDTIICEGNNVTVNFDGILNSAFAWSLVINDCPISTSSYMIALDTSHQITFFPDTYVPYYAFVNGTCTPPTICYPINLMFIPNDMSFGINEDSVCTTYAPILINASPPGGILSGVGVDPNMNTFDPSIAGPGVHIISYSFSLPSCTVTEIDSITVLACLGIDEDESSHIIIYPNPSENHITIQTSKNIDRVEIIDMMGKIVYFSNSFNNMATINMESFNPGIYLVKTYAQSLVSTHRIIKQ